MVNTNKIRNGLIKILSLALSWMAVGILYTFFEYMIIMHFADGIGVNPDVEYDFNRQIIVIIAVTFIGGLIIGAIEYFFFRNLLRKKSFGSAILIKSIVYSVFLFLLITAGSFLYNSLFTERTVTDERVLIGVTGHIFSPSFWAQIVFWTAVIIATQFMIQVSDKFGEGVLWQFIRGKYFKPQEEQRIFMFLDIRSATSIAEKLGHENYFSLLNDFFDDITDPIIFHKGEIYQYVGDEVTISWEIDEGIKNLNCIKCFFEIKRKIRKFSYRYKANYGLVPEFKAGLHMGKVIIGQVGVVKKDIVFSGDVLNTTSRIQEKCNLLKTDVLISETVYYMIDDKAGFNFENVGSIDLKGKEKPVTLYTVQEEK